MASMHKILSGYAQRQQMLETSTNPLSKGVAWVAGEIVPLHEARMPLVDEGFLRGDLTYDVPAVWDGRFFRLDDHLNRLEASCQKLRLKAPLEREELKRVLLQMVAMSEIRDAYVELIVTRGLTSLRAGLPESLKNNLYLIVIPYVWVMDPASQSIGCNSIITRTVRRIPPGAMDPTIKNLQWGDFVRAMLESIDRGSSFPSYPVLTDGDSNLTEGPGFNIVLIKDNILYTPDRGVLHGVTRKTVLEVAQSQGVEVRVEVVPVELAYRADEIFMCTTAGGIMPLTSLEGRPIGDGKVGPVTKAIWDGYWALHYDPRLTIEVDYHNAGDVDLNIKATAG